MEHTSGTKNMVVEVIVMLASSTEEINELFESITQSPIYRTNLSSLLLIAINTGGLLGILALKKVQ